MIFSGNPNHQNYHSHFSQFPIKRIPLFFQITLFFISISNSLMEEGKLADSTHSVPLDEVALHHQEEDLEEGAKKSPEISAGESVNGSPDEKSKTPKSVKWSEQLVSESTYTPSIEPDTSPKSYSSSGSNPYVSHSSAPSPPSAPSFKGLIIVHFHRCNWIELKKYELLLLSIKIYWKMLMWWFLFMWLLWKAERMDTVKDVLGRWGKNVKDAAKKAEDFAGNTWQHCMISIPFSWLFLEFVILEIVFF